jgi:hypothetical protein
MHIFQPSDTQHEPILWHSLALATCAALAFIYFESGMPPAAYWILGTVGGISLLVAAGSFFSGGLLILPGRIMHWMIVSLSCALSRLPFVRLHPVHPAFFFSTGNPATWFARLAWELTLVYFLFAGLFKNWQNAPVQ